MVAFCSNCGSALKKGESFCTACGAEVAAPAPDLTERINQPEHFAANISLLNDGKYRWVYEMNLLRNPTVFYLIGKILFIPFILIFAVTTAADLIRFGISETSLQNVKIFGIVFLVVLALMIVSYLIYAAIMGGKYIVEFEMDEKGILHKQIAHQAKKAKKLGAFTALAGAAKGNLATAGTGINATRTEMYSDFLKTKTVKVYPRRNLIKVNGLLNHNQVYAAAEDFEFVKDYIISHGPNIKNKP